SSGRTRPSPPSFSTSSLQASNSSRLRAISPIFAPCFANPCAMARPNPAEAPVTITTWFLFILFPLLHFQRTIRASSTVVIASVSQHLSWPIAEHLDRRSLAELDLSGWLAASYPDPCG